MKESILSKSGAPFNFFVKVLLYTIVMSNVIILSMVFLYPRLHFMLSHWGASERELLLSEGSRDNPNMESLREVYTLMYFVKDTTEEKSVVYFINPTFTKAYAYKILLPREVNFIESDEGERFFENKKQLSTKNSYLVFRKEDLPDIAQERQVAWSEEGWGVCTLW